MTIWYHPKHRLIGQMYPRPKFGPIYWSTVAKFRIYVADNLAYPIQTTPESAGWVLIGRLD